MLSVACAVDKYKEGAATRPAISVTRPVYLTKHIMKDYFSLISFINHRYLYIRPQNKLPLLLCE